MRYSFVRRCMREIRILQLIWQGCVCGDGLAKGVPGVHLDTTEKYRWCLLVWQDFVCQLVPPGGEHGGLTINDQSIDALMFLSMPFLSSVVKSGRQYNSTQSSTPGHCSAYPMEKEHSKIIYLALPRSPSPPSTPTPQDHPVFYFVIACVYVDRV